MQQIALSQYQQTDASLAKGSQPTVTKVMQADNVVAYNVAGQRTVFVCSDSRFRPVLGYTNTTDGQIPCCLEWWIGEINNTINRSEQNVISSFIDVPEPTFNVVGPMIKTFWGQDEPFNSKTPKKEKKHTPTGCAATALAQVLYHNRFPESADFIGSYSIDNGLSTKEPHVSSTYDYAAMKVAYGTYYDKGYERNMNYNILDESSIGTLMRDCGYSMGMEYDHEGSGALIRDVAVGCLKFGYPIEAVNVFERALYTDNEWKTIIYNELMSGSPIIFGGVDRAFGGHAFVVHGINAEGLVDVNWGWNGKYDGCYAIDIMNPSGYTFSSNQQVITGLRKTPRASDRQQSSWYGTFNLSIIDGKLCLSTEGMYNINYMTFAGDIYLVVEDESDGKQQTLPVVIYDEEEDNCYDTYYGFTIPEPESFEEEFELVPNHSYRVYAASQIRGQQMLDAMRTDGGVFCHRIEVKEDASINIITKNNGDKETAIATPVISISHTGIFNISGQKVRDNYRGIVIKNGKKTVKN